MISVRCPDCDTRLEVDDEHLGQDVRCPSCRAVFAARPADEPPVGRRRRDDDEDRPRRRASDDDDDEYDRPRRRRSADEVVDDARRSVMLPGIFSVASGILGLVYHVADAVIILANPNALANNPLMKQFGGKPPPIEVTIGIKAFVLLYALAIIAGAFAMMRLKARPFAITTAVMQLIPCLGPCCLLTLPFGIWALIVLMQPDVRDGFALAADRPARGGRRGRGRDRDDDDFEEDDRWRDWD